MTFAIRPYHPSDLCALYRVCLLTGDSGSDASLLYRDPELLGHVYVGPYAVLEPDLSFVLTHSGSPCGYVLGTRSSVDFYERCERDWFPVLRERYPLPSPEDVSMDAAMIRHIHAGHRANPGLAAYPAHLHIDLLPAAQGSGWGRKMIETLLNRMRASRSARRAPGRRGQKPARDRLLRTRRVSRHPGQPGWGGLWHGFNREAGWDILRLGFTSRATG